MGNTWLFRQDPLRPGCLLRVAGRGKGLRWVDSRAWFRAVEAKGAGLEGSTPRSRLSRTCRGRRDRGVLPALLLHSAREHRRDGGDTPLQRPGVRSDTGVVVLEGAPWRTQGPRVGPDYQRDLPGRWRL